MRFPDIDVMERVGATPTTTGANPKPKPWSLVGKLNEQALKRGEPEPLKIGEYIYSVNNSITMCADYTAFHHPQNGVRKIGKVDWKIDPFGFSKTRGGNVPDEYVKGPPALELHKANGQLMTADEWEGPSSLLSVVIEPYVDALNKDFEKGYKLLMTIDKKTMRQMLFDKYKSETIVTFIETAGSEVTGYFEKAASEIVIDNMDFTSPDGKPTNWYLFEGGTSTLTDAMFDSLRSSGVNPVKVDHQVRKLAFTGQSIIASGVEAVDGKPLGEGNPFEYSYSHVITAMTNHAFRLIDTTDCRLEVAKKTAIRCLTYDHSTKVALKFKTRFWEQSPSLIKGGSSTTDMPIRQVVYPSYGSADDTGVIIASYSWADDADYMGNLSVHDEARAKELCIKNLATLHNLTYDDLKDECIDYKFMDWAAEKYAQGAYAMFTPGQFSSQFRDLISPSTDERLFFAGEHASHHHAWIVGSLNSAYRSVDELLAREGLTAKRYELREKWGVCDESDAETRHRYPLPPLEAVADEKAVADFKMKANPVPNGKAAKGLLCGWRQVPNGL